MDNSEALEAGRRLARRRWAAVCFYALMAEGAAVLISVLLNPARADVASALGASSSVLLGFFSFQTVIVCAYLGVSLADSWRRSN